MIDDGAPYQMSGYGITLGSGGLTATTADSSGLGGPVLDFYLVLNASQTWSIDGGPAGDGVTVAGNIAGSGYDLTVDLSNGAYLGSETKTGASSFVVNGASSSNSGSDAGLNGQVLLGSPQVGADTLNERGGTATVSDAEIGVLGSTDVGGPLTLTGGQLLLGGGFGQYCCSAFPILDIAGALSPDSASDTTMFVGAGQTPGSDYAQIGGAANISLNGTLKLDNLGANGCIGLTPGDLDTLVTTPGTLSGAFSNAPDGSTVTFQCGPAGAHATGIIHYNYSATPRTVTVQIVNSPAGSTTTIAASPTAAVTNQPVMLTATISPASGVPTGTVEFDDNGSPISGCASRPLSAAAPYSASCQTSFIASASPESLSASFNSSSTTLYGSDSDVTSLAVGLAATTTTIAASSAAPASGANVTYTATVAPAYGGPATPAGSVAFTDGSAAVSGCSARPLTAGGSSATATCTVSYPAAGSHSITGRYGGDANFAASASGATTISVQSPAVGPSSVAPPIVSGSIAKVGERWSATTGSWTGTTPISYRFQWRRCGPAGCVDVPGANSGSYQLARPDLGQMIRVVVTAGNSAGSAAATSGPSGAVLASDAEITALLMGQITPRGKAARIAVILRTGGYALRFQALEAGRGSVSWYLVPKGVHITKTKLLLIATRSVSFTAAGATTLKVRLTTAGRKLLRSAGHISLTGKGVFTPTGQPALRVLRTFTLKR